MFSEHMVRVVSAKKKLSLSDDFKFIEFDDINKEMIKPDSPIPDNVEIWAAIQIHYNGEIPESYKTLNLIIGDWVEEHEENLSSIVNEKLKEHFQEYYPASEFGVEEGDSSIWLDQLDYMPRIDPSDNSMIIEIELVLDTEPLGD